MEECIRPKVEERAEMVRTLGCYNVRCLQAACNGLEMLLQSEWQYLKNDVPGVGDLMGTVEEALS